MERKLPMSSERWPGLAGRIEGRRHILPVRVYFEDTDAGGLVYHASFIRWFERGRSDFLRLLGLNQSTLMTPEAGGEPMAFVVRRIAVDYMKPGRLDDVLEVITESGETSNASLTLKQQIERDGEAICRAEVTCVLISLKGGRPLRLKSALPASVQNFFREAE